MDDEAYNYILNKQDTVGLGCMIGYENKLSGVNGTKSITRIIQTRRDRQDDNWPYIGQETLSLINLQQITYKEWKE